MPGPSPACWTSSQRNTCGGLWAVQRGVGTRLWQAIAPDSRGLACGKEARKG